MIGDNDIFHNDSGQEQWPVPYQLAATLYHLGHFGSAASVEAVAQWAGCSAGAIVKATCHVIMAFLQLHDQAV